MDRPPVNHIAHATREIPLTKGFVAIVDAADAPLVAGYAWRALISKTRETPYAAAQALEGGRQRTVIARELRGEFAALNFPDRSAALVAEDRLFFTAATGLDLGRLRAKAAAAEAKLTLP